MSKTRLDPSVHDNHELRLWHDWQGLTHQTPQLAQEWQYQRDEEDAFLAGPGESLTRTIGNVCLHIVLGGNGLYTPRAEMVDQHGVETAGLNRVRTTASRPQTDNLFMALTLAEEAAGEVGLPDPPDRHRRHRR